MSEILERKKIFEGVIWDIAENDVVRLQNDSCEYFQVLRTDFEYKVRPKVRIGQMVEVFRIWTSMGMETEAQLI